MKCRFVELLAFVSGLVVVSPTTHNRFVLSDRSRSSRSADGGITKGDDDASVGSDEDIGDNDVVFWQELVPDESSTNGNSVSNYNAGKKAEKRSWFWSKKHYVFNEAIESHVPRQGDDLLPSKTKKKKPHPIRTNEWKLNLSFGNKQKPFFEDKHMVLEFSANGYVRVLSSPPPETKRQGEARFSPDTAVGKWSLNPSGVDWSIPVRPIGLSVRGYKPHGTVVILHYHADLHLNQFGAQPRMVRGIVTRDRYESSTSKRHHFRLPKTWLRPVIATFTAEGVGQDTADISYQERGFGLPQPEIQQK